MKNFFLKSRSSFLILFAGFVIMLFAVISCNKSRYTYSYSDGLKPLPGNPWLPTTPYTYPGFNNNDVVTLGRVLFYDKHLSADNSVACGSCHQQANGFSDNKSFSTGFGGQQTTRNAHSLVSTNDSKFWDGKVAGNNNNCGNIGYSGQSTAIITVPIQNHIELNMPDGDVLSTKLSALSYYPYLFERAFQSTTISLFQIEQAIGSFIGTITASNSKYDQAFPSNGSFGSVALPATITLSAQEQAGMDLFNGKAMCSNCHIAANSFGGVDGQFEDIGLDVVYKDLGRGLITQNPSDNGRFHVPSLKNVALSAPYMHDGRFTTLAQVVAFFSDSIHNSPNLSSAFTAHPNNTGTGFTAGTGGAAVPLGLTATEQSKLVAFLQTLTDNSLVTDIRYSDPFKH